MRGQIDPQKGLFSYFSIEERTPADHPLCRVKAQADVMLTAMGPEFEAMYAAVGRPSIAPERLIEHEIAKRFFAGVLEQAKAQRLLSDEHFTVDGTLIESWASFKSLKWKDGEPPKSGPDGTGVVDFNGERRLNATHVSSTDPEAKLMRKGNGQPAKRSFGAHALMENRSGLLVDVAITDATVAKHARTRRPHHEPPELFDQPEKA